MDEEFDVLREELANLCHEQWVGWMNHLFANGVSEWGAFTIPAEFAERWRRQMKTPYSGLSKSEQDSDRREADKFLEVMQKHERAVDG